MSLYFTVMDASNEAPAFRHQKGYYPRLRAIIMYRSPH